MYRSNVMRTGYVEEAAPLFRAHCEEFGRGGGTATVGLVGLGDMLFSTHLDGNVIAWKAGTAELRWQRTLLGDLSASPLLLGEHLFVPCAGGGLYALDTDTGEILWRSSPQHAMSASPLLFNDKLWCGTLDGYLLGISPETGVVLDQFLLHQQGFFSTAASSGAQLFWGSPDGALCAFDLARGKMSWRHQTHSAILACPAIVDDQVLIGTAAGHLSAHALSTGKQLWTTWLGSPLHTPLAVDRDEIFAVSQDGAFHVLQRTDGQRLGRYTTEIAHPYGGPLATTNGVIFFGKGRWAGQMYIYDRSGRPTAQTMTFAPTTAPTLLGDSIYIGTALGGYGVVVGQTQRAPVVAPTPAAAPAARHAASVKPAVKPAVYMPPKPIDDPRRAALRAACNPALQSAYGMFRETPNRAAVVQATGVYDLDGVRWERQLDGGTYATPVIVKDIAYCCTFSGTVIALDLDSGTTRWETHLDGRIFGTPAIVGDTLIVGSESEHLYALHRLTGEVLSSKRIHGAVKASPVVVDGIVYIGTYTGMVIAYQMGAEDHILWSPLWSFQAEGSIHSSVAISGDLAVFGCKAGYVYGLDRLTGDLLWTFETGGWIYSSPAIKDGVVYVGSDDGSFYVLDGYAQGQLLWKYTTGDEVVASPAVTDDVVYVGSRDHHVYAFDRNYGQLLWKYRTDDFVYGSPVVAGDVLYFASVDNYVYALERSTGALLWKFHHMSHVWASPAITDGLVLAVDSEGGLVALQSAEMASTHRATGRQAPSHEATPPTTSSELSTKSLEEQAIAIHASWDTANLIAGWSLDKARQALLEQLLVRPYSLRLQEMLR